MKYYPCPATMGGDNESGPSNVDPATSRPGDALARALGV
jgi:hypothetical protein